MHLSSFLVWNKCAFKQHVQGGVFLLFCYIFFSFLKHSCYLQINLFPENQERYLKVCHLLHLKWVLHFLVILLQVFVSSAASCVTTRAWPSRTSIDTWNRRYTCLNPEMHASTAVRVLWPVKISKNIWMVTVSSRCRKWTAIWIYRCRRVWLNR